MVQLLDKIRGLGGNYAKVWRVPLMEGSRGDPKSIFVLWLSNSWADTETPLIATRNYAQALYALIRAAQWWDAGTPNRGRCFGTPTSPEEGTILQYTTGTLYNRNETAALSIRTCPANGWA